ncbi:glycosyltransferase family 4 protein [Longimicrobium sp.]|uniref:glycosyltransferase family 4 protein n=1 Tax=Longimicrobium sp. TaxID=2029185 RepID=UPI002C034584|nr:glycosyltransferase family 4 protein [Longimicrobium sp.]HSU15127.1 glycosyltransferase family 4 protein [Longimicrobium sp.]
MICILHGYLLEGSGSNLWTRSVVESLCRNGETVHLMAQENHPDRYPFITEARRYAPDGTVETFYRADGTGYAGQCILHKPVLGDTLPVYVWDRYEEFPRVVPMVDLPDDEIEAYVETNVRALTRIVRENGVTAIHANHAVLMSVVAQRVCAAEGIPFSIMPHGSALEYAVKRDARFLRLATDAFAAADRIFVHGDEMRARVHDVFAGIPGLDAKMVDLHLGVDTSQFEPVPRAGREAKALQLRDALVGVPRGRTPEQTAAMLAGLRGDLAGPALEAALGAGRGFASKSPDAGLEEKLDTVDWEHGRTLLYVGRLISAKGVQEVVAALPLILERAPEMRLLLVGHGPLREPLEAMLWALEHGERALFAETVARGRALEGDPEGEGGGHELTKVARFVEDLEARGELDAYFEAGRRNVRSDRVIFTGYLTHRELRHLFPCCDAAVFPSVVKEAGPLVFLEALASGAFPLGTYFGGMKASIDSVAEVLPPEVAEVMKLDPAPAHTVADIVHHVPLALEAGERYKEALFRVARDRYDWSSVSRTLSDELSSLSATDTGKQTSS